MRRVVLDTNVLVAALRSTRGASFALVRSLPSPRFRPALSLSLLLEYLDVLHRPGMVPSHWSPQKVTRFCRGLLKVSEPREVYFHWPAYLPDPKDNLVLDLAVAAGASHIVTHNVRHFPASVLRTFGVTALEPGEFLRLVASSSR